MQLLGSNHPDVAKQFINLAILCTHLGRYDEVSAWCPNREREKERERNEISTLRRLSTTTRERWRST